MQYKDNGGGDILTFIITHLVLFIILVFGSGKLFTRKLKKYRCEHLCYDSMFKSFILTSLTMFGVSLLVSLVLCYIIHII